MPPASPEHWLVRTWRAFDAWFFGPSQPPVARTRGAMAEELAARYLQAKGFRVIERNWKCGRGELDLVCEDGPGLVIVEVKSARSDAAYHGATRVGPAKRRQLAKLTGQYVKQGGWLGRPVRVDVVEVTFPREGEPTIRHIEGAVAEQRR